MAILRILYVLWLVGAVLIFARGLSQMVFGSRAPGINHLWRSIFLALVWPIALLSSEGRAALRALARTQD
jgi:hypothetical protein